MRVALLLIACLCIPCSIADAQAVWGGKAYSGRVCSNPSCQMCASIQQQLSQAQTVQSQREHQADQQYEMVTEYKTVQRRVKRCNGRQCWYETINERVPVQVRRPIERQPQDLTEWVPTPMPVVSAMVGDLGLTESSHFYDVGCGDGRMLISAARRHRCLAIGIELNEETAKKAKRNAIENGLADRVRVVNANARECDLGGADAVGLYLYPELMEVVVNRLSPGTRIVSYQHAIPGVEAAERTVTLGGEKHRYFVGVKE